MLLSEVQKVISGMRCPMGNQTGVLGPGKPVQYPLSGGTLLYLLTVRTQPWWLGVFFHQCSHSVDRSRHTVDQIQLGDRLCRVIIAT